MKKCLVISGGGVYGAMFLGALTELETKHDNFDSVTHFIGSSVGGMICACYACGYKAHDMFETVNNLDLDALKKDSHVSNLFTKCGLSTGETLFSCVRKFIVDKFDRDVTFKELYDRTGIVLDLTGVNLTKLCLEYFNHRTFPDMPVSLAVELTCNVPLLFVKKTFRDQVYVDGSCGNNFPLGYAKREYGLQSRDVLGLCKEISASARFGPSLADYVKRLVKLMTLKTDNDDQAETVCVPEPETTGASVISFDHESLRKLFNHGAFYLKTLV